ncbi:glycosyltransferase family 2 protein [Brevibacillus fulvus]|uniref:dTDP-glucose pyrophosphorylase n=1 Tax=Brevibacillus fulvus TaxID=1125967 RepID=A0A939BNU6_9BACL|nr:glycosyltransferase family 2 protein [Brevibacillus fulvus]MBM7589650.1 dTDP-glucose pyrophosphorylase [Brevibacillus fulvus]
MNIVLPMAGLGHRFRAAGYEQPKQLINVLGKPMFYWALDSLRPFVRIDKMIFVCLREHLEAFPLKNAIYRYCPQAKIVSLDCVLEGQAKTVLAAKMLMKPDEPLLIYNCDTFMYTRKTPIWSRRNTGSDGVISVFRASDDCFSYVQLDPTGLVKQVKEKEVISPYATTGLYQFAKARYFVEAAEEAIASHDRIKGEYYIAPLYNRLIDKGFRFEIDPVHACFPLGTPEQLASFVWYVRNLGRQRQRQVAAI